MKSSFRRSRTQKTVKVKSDSVLQGDIGMVPKNEIDQTVSETKCKFSMQRKDELDNK